MSTRQPPIRSEDKNYPARLRALEENLLRLKERIDEQSEDHRREVNRQRKELNLPPNP